MEYRREKVKISESSKRKRKLLVGLTVDSVAVSEVFLFEKDGVGVDCEAPSRDMQLLCRIVGAGNAERAVFVLYPAKICRGKESLALHHSCMF